MFLEDQKMYNGLMEFMVDCFNEKNLSAEKISIFIKDNNEYTRESMRLIAIKKGYENTAKEIEHAIEILKQERINNFKEAVEKGEGLEFLSKMPWYEKYSLKDDMNLSRYRISGELPSDEKEQIYLDLIKKSIVEDLKQDGVEEQFYDLEELRANKDTHL